MMERNMEFLEILKNVFDILALAAILFFIYRFAVKRRALKLALGVVLFLLVMLVVDAAELNALGFVFGDFRQNNTFRNHKNMICYSWSIMA